MEFVKRLGTGSFGDFVLSEEEWAADGRTERQNLRKRDSIGEANYGTPARETGPSSSTKCWNSFGYVLP